MGYGLGLLLQCGLNNAAATAILNYSDKLTDCLIPGSSFVVVVVVVEEGFKMRKLLSGLLCKYSVQVL